MSIKSPLLGHVTPDTKKILKSSFNFYGPLNFFGIPIILFTGAWIVLILEAFQITLITFQIKLDTFQK